jgi:hypothetical protein
MRSKILALAVGKIQEQFQYTALGVEGQCILLIQAERTKRRPGVAYAGVILPHSSECLLSGAAPLCVPSYRLSNGNGSSLVP